MVTAWCQRSAGWLELVCVYRRGPPKTRDSRLRCDAGALLKGRIQATVPQGHFESSVVFQELPGRSRRVPGLLESSERDARRAENTWTSACPTSCNFLELAENLPTTPEGPPNSPSAIGEHSRHFCSETPLGNFSLNFVRTSAPEIGHRGAPKSQRTQPPAWLTASGHFMRTMVRAHACGPCTKATRARVSELGGLDITMIRQAGQVNDLKTYACGARKHPPTYMPVDV